MNDALHRPVCVVVVNWNGWRDTQACVRSLYGVHGNDLWIVICDNGSTDGSCQHLQHWLSDELGIAGVPIRSDGPRPDAVTFDTAGGHAGQVRAIHLLSLPENHGYAGALNRGIAWGSEQFSAESFWLLNNDVKAEPTALSRLVAARDLVPGAGVCGSVLLEWDQPDRVQAIGGVFRKLLGIAWHIRRLPESSPAFPGAFLDIDYPIGASLLVERDYLDKVGPMDESYFLYCEEMDWVERGRRHGYRPVVALESRLFHKEGASTASHGGVRHLSMLSERYSVLNRLRITRKFWPLYLPGVWLSLWAVVLDRLLHGETARARLVLRLMFSTRLWLRKAPANR